MVIVLLFSTGILSGFIISFLWGKIVVKTPFANKDLHSLRGVLVIGIMLSGILLSTQNVGLFLVGLAIGLVFQHSHHKDDQKNLAQASSLQFS